jgi:hypothetical protein
MKSLDSEVALRVRIAGRHSPVKTPPSLYEGKERATRDRLRMRRGWPCSLYNSFSALSQELASPLT